MKISHVFQGKYLKAADLGGRQPVVRIDRVELEEVGDGDHKPVLYFAGKTKGVVLNKTNASAIAIMYGDDTEDWIGQEIMLMSSPVTYQGKVTEGIRIARPPRKAAPAKPAPKAVVEDEFAADEFGEEDPNAAPF